MKSWTKNGETYYLHIKGDPVYSYNDLARALHERGDKMHYLKEPYDKVVRRQLNYISESLDRAGISRDEPILDELGMYYATNRTWGGGSDANEGNIQDWSAAWTPYIMTETEWKKANKGTLADRIAKGAIIATGTALTAGGLSGAIGGISPVTGEAVAGSLWSPAGAAVAGDAVATASPVALTSAEGITASPLAPLAGTGGGAGAAVGAGTAATGAGTAAGLGGILKGAGGALLGGLGDAVVGAINYSNNKDAYNAAADAQREYLDKMLGINDGTKDKLGDLYDQGRGDIERYYNQSRADGKPYVDQGFGGLSALENYYRDSPNVWGALGNLAGVNGREGQQAAINMIENSPAFEAMVKQGENAILQNASATGGLRGGNTQYALAQFRPQILAQLMDKQYQQLYGMAGVGRDAASSAGQIGASALGDLINAGSNAGNNLANLAANYGGDLVGLDKNLIDIYGKMADNERDRIMNLAQNRAERNAGYGNVIGKAIGYIGDKILG